MKGCILLSYCKELKGCYRRRHGFEKNIRLENGNVEEYWERKTRQKDGRLLAKRSKQRQSQEIRNIAIVVGKMKKRVKENADWKAREKG